MLTVNYIPGSVSVSDMKLTVMQFLHLIVCFRTHKTVSCSCGRGISKYGREKCPGEPPGKRPGKCPKGNVPIPKKFLDPNCDPDSHQNLIPWATALSKLSK